LLAHRVGAIRDKSVDEQWPTAGLAQHVAIGARPAIPGQRKELGLIDEIDQVVGSGPLQEAGCRAGAARGDEQAAAWVAAEAAAELGGSGEMGAQTVGGRVIGPGLGWRDCRFCRMASS
jgi:hypothetical protein